MPCGHWKYWKSLGNRQFNGMLSFNPPKNYQKEFEWNNYLTEINVRAVPFEMFSKVVKFL
jgi:hypothetical protein